MPFHIGGGIREFVDDMDRPALLERELMELDLPTGRSEFITVQVERWPFTRLESI